MWYPQFIYKFKLNDKNFISLLSKLYPDMKIERLSRANSNPHAKSEEKEIVYQEYANLSFKILTDVVNDLKSQFSDEIEFTIITERTAACATTWNVLPKFEPQIEYLKLAKNDREKYKASVQSIRSFILGSSQMTMRSPGACPQIRNFEDAWKVVNLLHEQVPFFCAMNAPSVEGIVLFSQSYAFLISYGKKNKNEIVDQIYPAFDIDDGFLPSQYGSIITDEMQAAFSQWKQNGRIGPVFVQPVHTLTLTDSQPTTPTSPLVRLSALNQQEPAVAITKPDEAGEKKEESHFFSASF